MHDSISLIIYSALIHFYFHCLGVIKRRRIRQLRKRDFWTLYDDSHSRICSMTSMTSDFDCATAIGIQCGKSHKILSRRMLNSEFFCAPKDEPKNLIIQRIWSTVMKCKVCQSMKARNDKNCLVSPNNLRACNVKLCR